MRKTVLIYNYRLIKQYEMEGNLDPKAAAKLGNKWSREGYTVEITIEEKKGGDESFAPGDITYLVEATRVAVELDENAVGEAQEGLATRTNVKGRGKR